MDGQQKEGLFKRLRQNHLLMMVVCCVAPLLIIIMLITIFGVSRSYFYWVLLLLCPLMHWLMMKDMHKGHHSDETNAKKKGGCH